MDNFIKQDIKNGAVVELRNGERYLKVDDTLLRLDMSGNFMPLQKYDNNLNCILSGVEGFDIMKVLNPRENALYKEVCNIALFDYVSNFNNIKWTWERKEIRKIKLKDMTMEQYAKWLEKNCIGEQCRNCIFRLVRCNNGIEGWVCNKHLYSEKFLNQEVEIEE